MELVGSQHVFVFVLGSVFDQHALYLCIMVFVCYGISFIWFCSFFDLNSEEKAPCKKGRKLAVLVLTQPVTFNLDLFLYLFCICTSRESSV